MREENGGVYSDREYGRSVCGVRGGDPRVLGRRIPLHRGRARGPWGTHSGRVLTKDDVMSVLF